MKTNDESPEQENLESKEDDSNDCLTCCSISSMPKRGSEDEEEEKGDELDPRETKLLMILGLSLTIPLVLIEIFYDDGSGILTDFILIALASPVQFILGKPFYLRFYMGLKKKRDLSSFEDLVIILLYYQKIFVIFH